MKIKFYSSSLKEINDALRELCCDKPSVVRMRCNRCNQVMVESTVSGACPGCHEKEYEEAQSYWDAVERPTD
jgi:Zn finger protein HypA/HybF involved in hydrogenase expression